jgi:hypothetical protein
MRGRSRSRPTSFAIVPPVVDESVLPVGWTLARVRSMVPNAELLDPDTHFVVAGVAVESERD